MGRILFILGGARSGKSAFAARLARTDRTVLVIATAQRTDAEMRRRIRAHRRSRPRRWRTVETPLALAPAVAAARAETVIVDCLTLWLSNLLLRHDRLTPVGEGAILSHAKALVRAARQRHGTVVVVSNEVGLGLVPATPLGRVYRDLLGRVNQLVAAHADHVYLMVAGMPLEVTRWAGR